MNILHEIRSSIQIHSTHRRAQRCRSWAAVVFFLALGSFAPTWVQADTPPAGTVIGNQASATYTDGSGVQREATSNVALTTVQQVGAVLLTADQTILVAPAGQVVFRLTIQNTGNGNDS